MKSRNLIPTCLDDAPVVLEAKGLRSREVKDVSFRLKRGEILGFAGLMGAGENGNLPSCLRGG